MHIGLTWICATHAHRHIFHYIVHSIELYYTSLSCFVLQLYVSILQCVIAEDVIVEYSTVQCSIVQYTVLYGSIV